MADTYDLRRGDDDAECKWAGAVRSAEKDAKVPGNFKCAVAATSPVRDLQRDLRRVGIFLCPQPNGTFDLKTEWAVREFQIYAKMATVAKEDSASAASEYVDKLAPVPTGTARYAGPVSGVYNAMTRAAMTHWIKESWRCPVVLDAWKAPKEGAPEVRVARNIWDDQEDVGGGVVKAVDFSGYYATPVPQPWRLGTRVYYKRGGRHGPETRFDDAWPEVEVLPETILGKTWANMAADERSTFRAVRGVSEVECKAFLDIGNAYDAGVSSTGIFHFIVGRTGDGELAGVLYRLAQSHASDYERGILFFGVDVTPPNPKVDRPRFKLSTDAGTYVEPKFKGAGATTTKEYAASINYLRTWHWFYRLGMLERTTPPFRAQQWTEAVDRMRLFRRKAIEAAFVTPMDSTSKPPVLATIADTFTSELAMGYILRWHVNYPKDVTGPREVDGKDVTGLGQGLVDALKKARDDAPQLAWNSPPSAWTDREEAALLKAIETVPKRAEVHETLPLVKVPAIKKKWKLDRAVVGRLQEGRGTFRMLGAAPAPAPQTPRAPAPAPSAPQHPAPGAPPPASPVAPQDPPPSTPPLPRPR